MDTIETSLGVAGLFTDRVNRFLGNVADELKQALSHNLETYTKNWYNRTSKVKTYIYREGSIDFYAIYFPLKLTKDRRKISIPEDIGKLFEESNYLTILGHAGSGKTMLMRHFFLSFLRTQTHIPVIRESHFSALYTDWLAINKPKGNKLEVNTLDGDKHIENNNRNLEEESGGISILFIDLDGDNFEKKKEEE